MVWNECVFSRHELVIGNASEEDEGEYECRVEASDGQIASCFTDVYFVQDDHGKFF